MRDYSAYHMIKKSLSRGWVGIQLTDLTPPHLLVPVQSHDVHFQPLISWSVYVFNELR